MRQDCISEHNGRASLGTDHSGKRKLRLGVQKLDVGQVELLYPGDKEVCDLSASLTTRCGLIS